MGTQEIRKIYKTVEVRLLVLLGLSLPFFGVVYLYYNSGNLNWELPEVTPILEILLSGFGVFLVLAQFLLFRKRMSGADQLKSLLAKVQVYGAASLQRIHLLFLSCLLDAAGLLFFKNPIFVMLFAITLVFFSLAKPSPDRIIRMMKLSKEEADLIREASRPQ